MDLTLSLVRSVSSASLRVVPSVLVPKPLKERDPSLSSLLVWARDGALLIIPSSLEELLRQKIDSWLLSCADVGVQVDALICSLGADDLKVGTMAVPSCLRPLCAPPLRVARSLARLAIDARPSSDNLSRRNCSIAQLECAPEGLRELEQRPPSPHDGWIWNWDGLGTDSPREDDVMRATRNIFLVRHAHYRSAQRQHLQVITELGRRQALLTGQRLNEYMGEFSDIHCSTMPRALQTAEIIANCLDSDHSLSMSDLLREGAPILPSPLTPRSNIQESSVVRHHSRIEAAFSHYFHRPPPEQRGTTTEILVGHANVIRYLVMRALQLPPSAWLRTTLCHCSVTWIQVRGNGEVILRSMGDAGHLPWDMQTV